MRKILMTALFALIFTRTAYCADMTWDDAKKQQDALRINVFVVASNVSSITEEGWLEAARLMKNLGVTGVYLDVYRGGVFPSKEALEKARDILRGQGLEVWAGITTTKGEGFGVADPFSAYWLCYNEPATQKAMEERVRFAAALFDKLIVDDFLSTNCKSASSAAEKGGRSWSGYFRDVMVEASRKWIVEPAHAQNPKVRVIIKYPQWYDRFHRFGYDVVRQPEIFDGVWVGTE
ncbi:MAG: hypothetical protein AB1546_15580, partial [bacterium]